MRRYSKEIATFVDDRNLLTIDTEKVQALSLRDFHVPKGETPRPVYRPLTKVEKLEAIWPHAPSSADVLSIRLIYT